MPGGLIQSVLCDECFVDYDRLDECFYYTMKNIVDRLDDSIEVYNPTDATKSLLLKQKDRDKMNNWKNRLSDKISKMEIITKQMPYRCLHRRYVLIMFGAVTVKHIYITVISMISFRNWKTAILNALWS